MGVAFVAHCLLNQNSKVGDGAHCAGVYSPVIDVLRDKGWRIEQLPCPELAFTGLNRFWAVREQLDTAAYRRHCERLAEAVAAAIAVRIGQDTDVVLVGVEGSPSMGVTVTSSDPLRGGRPDWPDGTAEHVGGEGIFVEEIRKALARRGAGFPRVAGETHPVTTKPPSAPPSNPCWRPAKGPVTKSPGPLAILGFQGDRSPRPARESR